MGLLLSKKGAPLEPGKGIVFCEDLPVMAGSSALELCGSTMFIKFLLTAEFEVLHEQTMLVWLEKVWVALPSSTDISA